MPLSRLLQKGELLQGIHVTLSCPLCQAAASSKLLGAWQAAAAAAVAATVTAAGMAHLFLYALCDVHLGAYTVHTHVGGVGQDVRAT